MFKGFGIFRVFDIDIFTQTILITCIWYLKGTKVQF